MCEGSGRQRTCAQLIRSNASADLKDLGVLEGSVSDLAGPELWLWGVRRGPVCSSTCSSTRKWAMGRL